MEGNRKREWTLLRAITLQKGDLEKLTHVKNGK